VSRTRPVILQALRPEKSRNHLRRHGHELCPVGGRCRQKERAPFELLHENLITSVIDRVHRQAVVTLVREDEQRRSIGADANLFLANAPELRGTRTHVDRRQVDDDACGPGRNESGKHDGVLVRRAHDVMRSGPVVLLGAEDALAYEHEHELPATRRANHPPLVHGPPGDQCRSRLSPLAHERAIGSRNSATNVTTSESFAGHSVFGSLFWNAVHCANVEGCSVKSGLNPMGVTSIAVSRSPSDRESRGPSSHARAARPAHAASARP